MNALMRENSEAFVTGHETVERSIASLREKMDRDHAALAANQAVLNEKINTVHHVLRDKIDERHDNLSAGLQALRDKLDITRNELNSRADNINKDLSNRIDTVNKELGNRIDGVSKELGNKIDTLSNAFAELRGFHKTVLWVCGGIVTALTVAISVSKAVGWI